MFNALFLIAVFLISNRKVICDASNQYGLLNDGWHGRGVEPFHYDPVLQCLGSDSTHMECPDLDLHVDVDALDMKFCCGRDVK